MHQSYHEKKSQQEHDQLNEARFENSETFSISSCSRKLSNHKILNTNDSDSSYDYRKSITELLHQSLIDKQYQTPEKSTHLKEFDKTKTANIKGKNGRLYKDICPICLTDFDSEKGLLQCMHTFCFACIFEWSATSTACPCCRISFQKIIKNTKGKVNKEIIEVQQKKMQFNQDDYFICYCCGRGDNQHVLLICDGCDFYSCHIFCDPALENQIPEGEWFCKYCKQRMGKEEEAEEIDQLSISTISAKFEEECSGLQEEKERPIAARTRSRNSIGSTRMLQRLRRRHN